MKKGIAITIAVVTFTSGVMLGNQYGRRDVVNSRPPVVEGQFSQIASQPSRSAESPVVLSQADAAEETSLDKSNSSLSEPIFLFTESGFVIYGAVSVAESGGLIDTVVNVWKMPSGLSETETAGNFVLGLYDQKGKEVLELKKFKLKNDSSAVVEASGLSVKQGQYLGIRAENEELPILTSEDVK